VFNRPDEIKDLLDSLTLQTISNFEVIIVEDGSTLSSEDVVNKYFGKFQIKYYEKANSGPAQSRNFGVKYSSGDYLIFLDSDCILPQNYLKSIAIELEQDSADAFGGADKADNSFTLIQKAINYSMTSFLTTGGIRGGRRKLDDFYPRSFNMGIKKEVFISLGGFSNIRFGEDIDLSIRIFEERYKCRFFLNSWVYHKRRTDFSKFFKQVYNSGIARINLFKKYPDSLKFVHCLPAFFTLGIIASLMLGFFYSPLFFFPMILFILIVFIDASIKDRRVIVGLLAIVASFVQLIGYGSGFLIAWLIRIVFRKKYSSAFNKNFYN
jgi:glycosyltransferase involved in cell wall biosynthesis